MTRQKLVAFLARFTHTHTHEYPPFRSFFLSLEITVHGFVGAELWSTERVSREECNSGRATFTTTKVLAEQVKV